jgi:hypothetical protein
MLRGKKKSIRKMKKTRANSLNPKSKLWVWDNFIKNNFKKNKVQSLTNLMLKYEIKIKKKYYSCE